MNTISREARAKVAHMQMAVLNLKFQRLKSRSQPQAAPRRAPRRPRPVFFSREVLEQWDRQREGMQLRQSHRERR
jgi:hypothetical protein